MRKVLIFVPLTASIAAAGCGTSGDVTKVIPDALDRTSLIYRPEIQQGNIVTQEQINELEPGMSRRQVQFVLGTPMLTDVFHADRWDYQYTLGRGSTPTEMRRVTVFFEDDRLTRIAGDLRPQPESERSEEKKDIVVSVPDWKPPPTTLLDRFLRLVGVDDE